jgi:uncharacterized coiled-coil protein SlyX
MNDDMIKIQETLTHHEKMLDDLNMIVQQQWDHIDLLKNHIKSLSSHIQTLQDDRGEVEGSATDFAKQNKPPHY